MIRDLMYFNNPILKAKCDDVNITDFMGQYLDGIVADMIDTMVRYKGCGLAAPQIGILKRIIVIENQDNGEHIAIINPSITSHSDKFVSGQEGCLSYPKIHKTIKRPQWIEIVGIDLRGNEIVKRFENMNARIVCHEIDHLNGRCLIGR